MCIWPVADSEIISSSSTLQAIQKHSSRGGCIYTITPPPFGSATVSRRKNIKELDSSCLPKCTFSE